MPLEGLKWHCLIPCTRQANELGKERISCAAWRAQKTPAWSKFQIEKRIGESRLKRTCEGSARSCTSPSTTQLLLLLMCPCVGLHVHRSFKSQSDFCLSTYRFNRVLCLSRSSDFGTKHFAAYALKLLVRSMMGLVI